MSEPPKEPPADGKDDFMARMEAIWADQRARGHVPRTAEEIRAEIQAMRDEAEEEFQAAERLHEECQRAIAEAKARAEGGEGPPS
jgi:hypothetical protein